MTFNQNIYHRRSIRLQNYDYSQHGAYFVTICTQNRACLFGQICNGKMNLNKAGQMIEQWYIELENKFQDIKCGDFICMPNHVHFIIVNVGIDPRCVCTEDHQTFKGNALSKVVQWFKTMTTNSYIHGVKNENWTPFYKRLWQRNYYEHIIRHDADLERIQQYIQNNPMRWQQDTLHTAIF